MPLYIQLPQNKSTIHPCNWKRMLVVGHTHLDGAFFKTDLVSQDVPVIKQSFGLQRYSRQRFVSPGT